MPIGGLRRGSKKAEEARQAEEAARQAEEAARKAEEARLAEQKLLEAAKLACKRDLQSPEGKLRDLLNWFNSIPLSRKCFNRIDREFSDGVLVAEIIEFYCPEICSTKHVFTVYSTELKLRNWRYLNRLVFPKLGFRLKESTVCNIIQPWGCSKHDKRCPYSFLIYDVLYKVQKRLAKENDHVFDYRNQTDNKNNENEKLNDTCLDQNQTKRQPRPRNPDQLWYSKIELQIANGTYDDYRNQSNKSNKNEMMEDWVKMYVKNGNIIVFDDDGCACAPKCYAERCCTAPPVNNGNSFPIYW